MNYSRVVTVPKRKKKGIVMSNTKNENQEPITGAYVPVTPGGTACTWLASTTEGEAWKALEHDARHMPYKGLKEFKDRGYRVEYIEGLGGD